MAPDRLNAAYLQANEWLRELARTMSKRHASLFAEGAVPYLRGSAISRPTASTALALILLGLSPSDRLPETSLDSLPSVVACFPTQTPWQAQFLLHFLHQSEA